MTEVERLYRFAEIVGFLLLGLAVGGFFGSVTSQAAFRRGHPTRRWFWLGFFLTVIALAAVHLIPAGPGAQPRRSGGFGARFRREPVWAGRDTGAARVSRTAKAVKVAVVAAAGLAGLLGAVGVARTGLTWGIVWGIVAAAGGVAALGVFSVATDPAPSVDPQAAEGRPASPRRATTLLPALVVITATFWLAGMLGDVAGGVVWGIVAAAGLVAGLRVAGERLDPADIAVVAIGVVASTVLTNFVLPDAPERATPNLALLMAAAWLPAAAGAAVVVWRRSASPARTFMLAMGWAGSGLMAVPAAVSYGALVPLSDVIGAPDPFGTAAYSFIGLAVGLVGGAFVLSALTGLNALATASAALFATVYAAAQVGFTIPGLIQNFANIKVIGRQMWPPDFEWAIGTGTWWWIPTWDFGDALRANPLIETFRIAVIACLIGVVLAIPLALRASRITAIRSSDYWFNKGIMNVIRTIPDLFWAMVFATSVGIGPFAGTLALVFFSMAIMAKLLSETVDAVDPRPIEAARATGSHHWPAIRTSVWPQVLPNYVAYALYIFEINIRASVVLGIVGAGGIGRVLEAQRSFFRFDRVLALVMVIFVAVFLIEQASVALRRRLV